MCVYMCRHVSVFMHVSMHLLVRVVICVAGSRFGRPTEEQLFLLLLSCCFLLPSKAVALLTPYTGLCATRKRLDFSTSTCPPHATSTSAHGHTGWQVLQLAGAMLRTLATFETADGSHMDARIGISTGQAVCGIHGLLQPRFSVLGPAVRSISTCVPVWLCMRLCSCLEVMFDLV